MLPLTALPSVTPQLAARLQRLNLHSVADLLLHLPTRYQDRSRLTPLHQLQHGQEVLIQGQILSSEEVVIRRRRFLLCHLSDGFMLLTLRFFNFNRAQQSLLSVPATHLRCFGEVRQHTDGHWEMLHPEWQRVQADTPLPEVLTAFYPSTAGLQQFTLRRLVAQALLHSKALFPELAPAAAWGPWHSPSLAGALRLLHQAPTSIPIAQLESPQHPARQRLAFEELLAHQLSLRRIRQQTRHYPAPALTATGLGQRFIERLPFALTAAQRRVYAEIQADLATPRPMLRLLQGDVGSGKTVVAALAALSALEAGMQAALMAPTELLAEQHYYNLRTWLQELGIEVAWLSGRLTGKARRQVLERLAQDKALLVVGTHALFQEAVRFANLALVIVDEQHRFGVQQRLALREKGQSAGCCPHQLIMTATPIPRTLAMSAYADLDTSLLDELPPGRRPVQTVIVPATRRDAVIERIRHACHSGRQAYWVCPLIAESEVLQCQAATVLAEQLAQRLPELRLGLAHGRMALTERAAVMSAFKAGQLDLLVATTVIEVGVDVANASIMVLENAERLGLAQLHQLRGRVGRGAAQSSCVLLYQAPLSALARERLMAVRATHDGFAIADRDLELRGGGELLGTRQTGLPTLRVADVIRDQGLLDAVRHSADLLLAQHPELVEPLIERWIGSKTRYAQV